MCGERDSYRDQVDIPIYENFGLATRRRSCGQQRQKSDAAQVRRMLAIALVLDEDGRAEGGADWYGATNATGLGPSKRQFWN